ncbi:MAG: phosphoenolpyruvate--protein phosphotransferase [Deltaproteobacteria bacterium CG2_30_66_27]|nr:MAG: phosphoenolpyruvate--protein phosphotransferase [Deltaproteobacteria bacterium CG2_30_66_27]PJB31313.1 MAG: phosphoenolpyruvate--protein phosphotransferase [Deltaproteobacteria bacterium CG_4_9_14_3_um_filter_65_9]
MRVLKGIPASGGIAIGKGFFLNRVLPRSVRSTVSREQVDEEVAAFQRAVARSREQILAIRDGVTDTSSEHHQILSVHLALLEDSMLVEQTVRTIRENQFAADWAFNKVLQNLLETFHRIKDPYLRERGHDLRQIGHRVLENLAGRPVDSIAAIRDPVVIVAHDLSPADTAQILKSPVLGFATDVGSRTSHTAITARSLGIPAVVGVEGGTEEFGAAETVIVDGEEGVVVFDPTAEAVLEYEERQKAYAQRTRDLAKFARLPTVTRDGKTLLLLANIEFPEEADVALRSGAYGVGLYRTEFLFLNRKDLPSEEEHFDTYRKVAEKFVRQPVTIRTFDLGGDKFASQLELADEMNPAMGLRAIRFCLKEKEIFKAQLRAILRASMYGKVRMMFPMISGVGELREAMAVVEEVRGELRRRRIPYDREMPIGIMIEIPAAAIVSDLLAREVGFFSIGTNDLIQYSLAIDRVNEHVSYLYEPLHPAILRLVRRIVEAGHDAGIPVSMCGEMAGEPLYSYALLGLGLDELSMNAAAIPRVKRILRKSVAYEAKEFAGGLLLHATAAEIGRALRKKMEDLFPAERF